MLKEATYQPPKQPPILQVHATPFLPSSTMVCNPHSNDGGAVPILRCKKI